MPTIEMENVTKYYKPERRHRREKKWEVGVEDISLTFKQGEFAFIIGSSGSGKSTLLKLVSGQEKASKGKVYVDNKDLAWAMKLSGGRLTRIFGMVSQEPSLIRKRTVADNLALAARIQAVRSREAKRS